MKIDLHVHASERSGCSISTEEALIAAAKARGLDALAFTDHEQLVPPEHLEELNRRHAPFRVFSGTEIHTAEDEDILVLGVQDPRLERIGWSYADLHPFVRRAGGFMILAHPFRYRDFVALDLNALPPDAVEKRSGNINPANEPRIRSLADEHHCVTIHASDAHTDAMVGRFFIDIGGNPDGDVALVSLLKAHIFSCGMLEE